MDVFSHGLWGLILAKGFFKKSTLWLAFLVGVLPDVIPFSTTFIRIIITGTMPARHDPSSFVVPAYTNFLYSMTHSLVVILFVFWLIYLIRKDIPYYMLAWPLHVLIDIPTHTKEFFPTPILFPLSNFSINGVSWSAPYIFFPNIILLVVALVFVFRKKLFG